MSGLFDMRDGVLFMNDEELFVKMTMSDFSLNGLIPSFIKDDLVDHYLARRIIDIAFHRSPWVLAYSLCNKSILNAFSDDEIEKAIDICSQHECSVLLLSEYENEISDIQIYKILDHLLLVPKTIIGLFEEYKVLNEKHELYLIDKILSKNLGNDIIYKIFTKILKRDYYGIGKCEDRILSHSPVRKRVFSIIAKDKNCIGDLINTYYHKERLNRNELILIHDLHEDSFFSELSSKQEAYYDYCVSFSGYLSYREQETLIKKLSKKPDNNLVQIIKNKVILEQEFSQQLDAILLANELTMIEVK